MARTSSGLMLVTLLAIGCHGAGDPVVDPDDTDAANDETPADAARPDGRPALDAAIAPDAAPFDYPYSDLDVGCAPIFAQWIVPDYYLTIAAPDWAAMQDEFLHPQFAPNGTLIDPPYHPVQVHIIEGPNQYDPPAVMVRLSGNTSWLQTILFDPNPKMQFLIAFNKIDPDGRFERQRKIKLDMPRTDWTFLQQRVALAWLRGRAGVPAQCANNARVFVNGEYYGLYTNAERQDKSFLDRVYGDVDDGGDLWKGARQITTNEDTFSWAHLTQFWDVTDLAGLDELTSLDTSMEEWASEAILGDSDGYNYGRANFYLYDRPSTGRFVWLANDLDTVLDSEFLEPDTTPVLAPTPVSSPRNERDWYHYLIAMNDPDGVARYVTAMAAQLPRLDPAEIHAWIEDWEAQIEQAAADDPHRPFSLGDHEDALEGMEDYLPARVEYLQSWLDCWTSGGGDGDGDGADMCHDCNDDSASQVPGAAEVCDAVDNDCDGRVDNLSDGTTCGPTLDADAAQRAAFWAKVLMMRRAPG